MPQLIPLSLALLKHKKLRFATRKNIRGPKPFLDCLKHDQWSEIKKGVDALVAKGIYQQQAPQYYWYRVITEYHVFEGFLSGVRLENKSKVISTHEAVLAERVKLFSDYLSAVNRQAEPILLMHEDAKFSKVMGDSIYLNTPDFDFREENEMHQLWVLTAAQAKDLESFAHNCEQFHLADGHHRLASTQQWGEK